MVVTILDNGKLLKPQTLEEGKLVPFFKTKNTNESGVCELSEEPEDWPSKLLTGTTKRGK